jgi:hypothetical protein
VCDVQPDQVPMPAAIAARPRDARGFPVLAITPWRDGAPDFAVTSPARILVCAVERRCSICGLALGRGPVWRVVAADEALALMADPAGLQNDAATVEPPGHRLCMLYAAVVCPWLARPNARRGLDAPIAGGRMSRGEARGAVGEIGGAVVAFDTYEFTVAGRVEFRYRGAVELLPHLLGEEHLVRLREGTALEEASGESCPSWLLEDEESARERAERYL